jgi:hypothetical protein
MSRSDAGGLVRSVFVDRLTGRVCEVFHMRNRDYLSESRRLVATDYRIIGLENSVVVISFTAVIKIATVSLGMIALIFYYKSSVMVCS